jgi:hypothetical protein
MASALMAAYLRVVLFMLFDIEIHLLIVNKSSFSVDEVASLRQSVDQILPHSVLLLLPIPFTLGHYTIPLTNATEVVKLLASLPSEDSSVD